VDWLRAKAARSFVALTLAAVSSIGCVAGGPDSDSESAGDERIGTARADIQGGFGDDEDLAVVGLAVTDGDGNIAKTCSGVLIAPNLVLTAQHCIASKAEFVSCADASFGPAVDPAHVYVTTDASMWAASTTWRDVVEVSVPPGAPAVCGRDVALVTLQEPVDGVKPLEPSLEAPCEPAEVYTAIGYGATDGGDDGAGRRRRRDGLEVVCVGGDCSTSNVTGHEWQGDHGICAGDSGSPAIDGRGRVFGITSRGPSGCDDPVYGGLVGHRAWLVGVAGRAAKRGHVATPGWAIDGATATGASQLEAATASSCAAAPGRATGEGAALVGLAAFALGAARRRRRCPRPR
jgi:trypsin